MICLISSNPRARGVSFVRRQNTAEGATGSFPLRKKESGRALAYIDLTGSANSEVLTSVCKTMLEQKTVSGLIFFPRTDAPAVSRDTPTRLAMLKRDYDQPVVLYNLPDPLTNSTFEKYGFPVFNSPENAVDGMAALITWGKIIREREK